MKIAVLGAGSWGSALSMLAAIKNKNISLCNIVNIGNKRYNFCIRCITLQHNCSLSKT